METSLQVREPDIAQMKHQLSALANDALTVTVTDKGTQELAASKRNALKDAIKVVEFERKSWTDPLEAQKKRLIAIFKPVVTELEFALSHIEQQLNRFYAEEREKEQKEQERLDKLAQKRFDKAVESGKPTPFPVPIAPNVIGQMADKSIGGVTYVTKWKARVTDSSKVPDEFWLKEINYHALDTIASDTKGTAVIPGVEFYEDSYIRGTR